MTAAAFYAGSVPGLLVPGAAEPGRPYGHVSAGAFFIAATSLLATPYTGPDLPRLFRTWQQAEAQAADLWQQWRMMRSVAATDGTAGFLYIKAYSAQQIADQAQQAYLTGQLLAGRGAAAG